jgi:hypothetical protein
MGEESTTKAIVRDKYGSPELMWKPFKKEPSRRKM